MLRWIVEGIAGYHIALIVAVAGTETCRIVVAPIHSATEIKLRTDIRDILHVWHAVVFLIAETCHVVAASARLKPVWRRHASEAIHHHHSAL